IFLRRRFFLSFDFHATGLLELSTPLITLGSRQFAAIQGDHKLAGEHSSSGEQLHHLVKQSLHLFLAEFADVVGQALGRDRSLLLWLTLHALVPLRFFLSLSLSLPSPQPLYQNVRTKKPILESIMGRRPPVPYA